MKSNDDSQRNSQESATSATVSVSSPVTLTADSEPSNSQVSESDVTKASLGQDFASHSKTVAEKECQTTDGVYLSDSEFEELLKKASFNPDFKKDLQKIKDAPGGPKKYSSLISYNRKTRIAIAAN